MKARRRGRSRIREILRALGIGALALLGQLACSAAGEPLPEPIDLGGVPAFALSPPDLPPAPADLLLACELANVRWEKAAGLSVDCAALPLQVGDSLPDELVGLLHEMPEEFIGATWPGNLIMVRPLAVEWGQEALDAIMLHELGHWHAGWEATEHPEDGNTMLSGFHLPTQINEGDLVWLCGFVDCTRFTPEVR